jgi:hypothetical protein
LQPKLFAIGNNNDENIHDIGEDGVANFDLEQNRFQQNLQSEQDQHNQLTQQNGLQEEKEFVRGTHLLSGAHSLSNGFPIFFL